MAKQLRDELVHFFLTINLSGFKDADKTIPKSITRAELHEAFCNNTGKHASSNQVWQAAEELVSGWKKGTWSKGYGIPKSRLSWDIDNREVSYMFPNFQEQANINHNRISSEKTVAAAAAAKKAADERLSELVRLDDAFSFSKLIKENEVLRKQVENFKKLQSMIGEAFSNFESV